MVVEELPACDCRELFNNDLSVDFFSLPLSIDHPLLLSLYGLCELGSP